MTRRVTMNACVDAMAKASGVARRELLGPALRREVSRPRQAAMALCVKLAGRSCGEAGLLFGRDSSTVWDGARATARRIAAGDAETARLVAEAARLLEAGAARRRASPGHGRAP